MFPFPPGLSGRELDVNQERTDLKELLREFVPKSLYEELRSRFEELLIKVGRMQEQMLFLLDYQLGEEKEPAENSAQEARGDILAHIRQNLEFESRPEKSRNRSATVAKLLQELREKYREIDRLRSVIEQMKGKKPG